MDFERFGKSGYGIGKAVRFMKIETKNPFELAPLDALKRAAET